MNQQPLRVVLVRSDDARARLVRHLAEGNNEKAETAPLVAVLAADNEFHEELPTTFRHFPQAKDLMFADRSVRERSARFNASLQVAYFILGIRAAGPAAGPMTGFDADGIDKEFFPTASTRCTPWSTSASPVRTHGSTGPPASPTTRSSRRSDTPPRRCSTRSTTGSSTA